MKKGLKRLGSAMIAVCMTAMLFPYSAIALGSQPNAADTPGVSILKESDLPENLDLQTVLERNHVERLYGEETELNSVTFKNADGTATVYLFDEAIKYVDVDGSVKDKSNKLTKVDGGYTNLKNDVNVLYPDNITNGVTMNYGEYSVKLVHAPQTGGNAMMSSSLAEFVTVENRQTPDKMIYDGVFGSNTYVEYIQNFNGFKENIVVKSAGEQTRFSYLLYTGGLTPVEESGGLKLVDGENNKICTFGKIYIYDSNGNTGYGEYEVVEIKESQIYGITLVADDFFELDDISYPVIVDPKLECESDELLKDGTIYLSNNEWDSGFAWLHVGTHSTRGVARALIGIKNYNLIENIVHMYNKGLISSIKLCVKYTNMSTPVTVNAHQINNYWNEGDDDDDYVPTIDYQSNVMSSYTASYQETDTEVEIEIKDIFSSVGMAQNGIMLKLSNETHPFVAIASTECGEGNNPGVWRNRPYITYTHILPDSQTSGITSGAQYQIKTSTGTLAISYPEYDSSNMTLAVPNTALSANQRFVITHIGSGKYEIATIDGGAHSGFLLGVTNGNLSVESPSGEDYQYWYIVPVENGYKIVNVAANEYCISRDESSVEATCNQYNNIIWIFSAV